MPTLKWYRPTTYFNIDIKASEKYTCLFLKLNAYWIIIYKVNNYLTQHTCFITKHLSWFYLNYVNNQTESFARKIKKGREMSSETICGITNLPVSKEGDINFLTKVGLIMYYGLIKAQIPKCNPIHGPYIW